MQERVQKKLEIIVAGTVVEALRVDVGCPYGNSFARWNTYIQTGSTKWNRSFNVRVALVL